MPGFLNTDYGEGETLATTGAFVQDAELTALLRMLTLDDLIAGVVAESEIEVFPSCTSTLHSFFSDLKDKGGMPKSVKTVLGAAIFEAGDWFPFSREVESALIRLQVGGLLSADNPEYSALRMKDHARATSKKRLSKQDDKTQAFVARAGKHFAATVGAADSSV